MKRYQLIVSGKVQNVGFRYHSQAAAIQYQLTGWVKNEPDGTVLLEVQGSDDQITGFIDALYQGNYFIRVHNIKKKEISPVLSETKYRIVY